MNKLIIYHGSNKIIEKPIFGLGKTYNDYGRGFYTTENLELAKEWACVEKIDGYANKYEIDIGNLKILNLTDSKYNVLNWLTILLENRDFRITTPLAKKGKEYLLNNFLINYHDYDAIIGYRADDSYFMFAKSFLMNEISLHQLEYAMKLGKLGEQFVLKKELAFNSLNYLGYEIANNSKYYALRKKRDDEARQKFMKILENDDIDGIFLRDIIARKMKNNDVRL